MHARTRVGDGILYQLRHSVMGVTLHCAHLPGIVSSGGDTNSAVLNKGNRYPTNR
jgi:hypothetical protein